MIKSTADEGTRIPPYIAFQTLKTFLADLKEHGLPVRIDRSVLKRFSGSVGTQLMSALRWLELIDERDIPTVTLEGLVEAYETNQWADELKKLLEQKYSALMKSGDLEAMTPSLLADHFKQYSSKEAVWKRCQRFFIQAAQEANVPISSRILKFSRQPSTIPRKRATGVKKLKLKKEEKAPPAEEEKKDTMAGAKGPYDFLIDILDPHQMSEEEQQAVWTLLRYLKSQETTE